MKYRNYLEASCLLLATTIAHAAPTAYPAGGWDLHGVTNPTGSTLIGDSNDPTLAYVMPPTAGAVAPQGFRSANANLGFCRDMANLQGYSRDLSAAIAKEGQREIDAEGDFKAKQADYDRLNQAAEALRAQNGDVKTAADLQDDVASLERRIDSDYDRLNACGSNAALCGEINGELKSLGEQCRKERDQYATLRVKLGDALAKYDRARAEADAAKQTVDHAQDVYNTIRAKIVEIRAQLMTMYSQYGQLEGGFTTIDYSSGWDDNVAKLRAENPGFRFEKIQTENVKVNVGIIGADSSVAYLASVPAILDYSVNGVAYTPYGVVKNEDLSAFPDEMAATLRLSLAGACPIEHPDWFGISPQDTQTATFGISATYEFPEQFHTRIAFSYNLYKFYELMQQSGSHGGLFSSSSWSSTSETRVGRDAFSADWEESDPDNQTSETDRRKVEAEVRDELKDRVLKMMATPVLDGHSAALSTPAVPAHGAIVVADGLQQSCGWYSYYCTGGAWILRGLDAIFGSSSTSQDFKSTYDMTSQETWTRDTVRLKPGVTVFVPAKKAGAQ